MDDKVKYAGARLIKFLLRMYNAHNTGKNHKFTSKKFMNMYHEISAIARNISYKHDDVIGEMIFLMEELVSLNGVEFGDDDTIFSGCTYCDAWKKYMKDGDVWNIYDQNWMVSRITNGTMIQEMIEKHYFDKYFKIDLSEIVENGVPFCMFHHHKDGTFTRSSNIVCDNDNCYCSKSNTIMDALVARNYAKDFGNNVPKPSDMLYQLLSKSKEPIAEIAQLFAVYQKDLLFYIYNFIELNTFGEIKNGTLVDDLYAILTKHFLHESDIDIIKNYVIDPPTAMYSHVRNVYVSDLTRMENFLVVLCDSRIGANKMIIEILNSAENDVIKLALLLVSGGSNRTLFVNMLISYENENGRHSGCESIYIQYAKSFSERFDDLCYDPKSSNTDRYDIKTMIKIVKHLYGHCDAKKLLPYIRDLISTDTNISEISHILQDPVFYDKEISRKLFMKKIAEFDNDISISNIVGLKKNNPSLIYDELIDYYCPLTKDLFVEPVECSDGKVYEKKTIVDWLSRNCTSPLTRQPMNNLMVLRTDIISDIEKIISTFNKRSDIADTCPESAVDCCQ